MRETIDHRNYRVVCEEAGFPVDEADSFIDGFLDGFKSSENPVILHTLGIPGAGKSTFARGLGNSRGILISFDDVMEKIPGYQRDKLAHGNVAAFSKWEECARETGYEILFRSVERRLDIVFDHSGARPDHVAFLRNLKQKEGYKIKIVAFQIDEDLARERALKRDRHLPPEYIADRKKVLEDLLPAYKSVADEFLDRAAARIVKSPSSLTIAASKNS